MSLKEEIQSDLTTAMREGDTNKRDTLRMVLAAIQQEEIDRQITLDDAGIQDVIRKQAKQRRESIDDAKRADRIDLATQERLELDIISSYMPQMMTESEIRAMAADTISDIGATSMEDMGKVMGQLMPKVKGQADGRLVSETVRDLLQS
jgi:uncharacterized protein YqeY